MNNSSKQRFFFPQILSCMSSSWDWIKSSLHLSSTFQGLLESQIIYSSLLFYDASQKNNFLLSPYGFVIIFYIATYQKIIFYIAEKSTYFSLFDIWVVCKENLVKLALYFYHVWKIIIFALQFFKLIPKL